MDILYQLPFPQEICSKIFMFACKSPHTGLSVAILKKILGLSFYKKIIEYKENEEDDKNVIKIMNIRLTSSQDKQLTFDISHLKSLQNLTNISLYRTGVNGDIENLKSMSKLTEIRLSNTGVTGNIAHLKSLPNLTEIDLRDTRVYGDEIEFHEFRER